jgi:hypothetical protein
LLNEAMMRESGDPCPSHWGSLCHGCGCGNGEHLGLGRLCSWHRHLLCGCLASQPCCVSDPGLGPRNMALTLFQPLETHTQDPSEEPPALQPPSQPQDSANGPCSQPSRDRSLHATSPPDTVSSSDNDLAVPVTLRKPRPVSMEARIQAAEEKQGAGQARDLSPAAARSQKAGQSRPNSSALETLGGERMANGGLELLVPAASDPSKRASDCGSMDYSPSLSADLSLNRETGSLSLKVMSPVTPQVQEPCVLALRVSSLPKQLVAFLYCILFTSLFWGFGDEPRAWCLPMASWASPPAPCLPFK